MVHASAGRKIQAASEANEHLIYELRKYGISACVRRCLRLYLFT